jgi:CRP-like cAMP-binding protein
MAYLSGKDARRSTDVIAKTEVTLIDIDPETLAHASANCRYQFSEGFLGILTKRLSMANTRLSRLLSDDKDEE